MKGETSRESKIGQVLVLADGGLGRPDALYFIQAAFDRFYL